MWIEINPLRKTKIEEWILDIKRARFPVTSQLPSKNRYMDKVEKQNREIQARVNKFLKNIQEIKHLIEVTSAIRAISTNLRNISLQDHGLQKTE